MTISEHIKALFRNPTELEVVQYELDMMTFERDVYKDAFVRGICEQATIDLTRAGYAKKQ